MTRSVRPSWCTSFLSRHLSCHTWFTLVPVFTGFALLWQSNCLAQPLWRPTEVLLGHGPFIDERIRRCDASQEGQALRTRWQDTPEVVDRIRQLLALGARSELQTLVKSTASGKADLRGLSCISCQLNALDLTNVDLSFADMKYSVLDDVTLDDSILDCADFRSSMLLWTTFYRSSLNDTDFREAALGMATFVDAFLIDARFDDARKLIATFVRGIADRAVFDRAQVQSSFDATWLKNTSWRDAKLRGSGFERTPLIGADFTGMKSEGVAFRACRIRPDSLFSLDLQGTSVPADGFDLTFMSEVAPPEWALIDVAALREIVRRAVAAGNYEFADVAYRLQRTLELKATRSPLRRLWGEVQRVAYQWGTSLERLGSFVLSIILSCAAVIWALTYVSGTGRGLSMRLVGPITNQGYFRGMWTALCVSSAYCFAVGFPGESPASSPIMAFASSRHVLAKGTSQRVLVIDWLLGKLAMYFLAETIARRYLA